MLSVVGVFASRTDADFAANKLLSAGLTKDQINLLTPGSDTDRLGAVPIDDMEERGVGEALGGVIGGTLGAVGGWSLGAAVASLFIPGIGQVVAIGAAAAAIAGIGGVVGGAKVAEALEENTSKGLPHDELFIYEDALRHGRTVLIAFVNHDSQRKVAQEIMTSSGAESLDAARENWWLGLRDIEAEEYQRKGHDLKGCESSFRCGFEAAQHPFARGKSYTQIVTELKQRYPDKYGDDAFRDGFERGRNYYEKTLERHLQPQ
jgi:hypothetical protein